MILQGNQRGGAKNLALHLLKEENDHVEVHELRGFISNDLVSALNESYAISRGTKAKQFLYSLSLNPPANENVSTEDFEAAIGKVEEKLGLSGQPRAIVFHEKLGIDGQPRRHCHAVWSRIDAQSMKAIPLPHTKYKLREISRELYIEHGWEIPRGFLDSEQRDPRNFTLAQWQQAKRQGKDPRHIKAALQDSWAISDAQRSFQQALKDRGFVLARGDRRGFVVLDQACEIYAASKWIGIRAKEVKARMTSPEHLPSVDDARAQIAKDMSLRLAELRRKQNHAITERLGQIQAKQQGLISSQKNERLALIKQQELRWSEEAKTRQDRYSSGIRGFFDRWTGKSRKIKAQNEQETLSAYKRDQKERDELAFRQIEQRKTLHARSQRLEEFRHDRQQALSQDIGQYEEISQKQREVFELRERMKNKQQHNRPNHEL